MATINNVTLLKRVLTDEKLGQGNNVDDGKWEVRPICETSIGKVLLIAQKSDDKKDGKPIWNITVMRNRIENHNSLILSKEEFNLLLKEDIIRFVEEFKSIGLDSFTYRTELQPDFHKITLEQRVMVHFLSHQQKLFGDYQLDFRILNWVINESFNDVRPCFNMLSTEMFDNFYFDIVLNERSSNRKSCKLLLEPIFAFNRTSDDKDNNGVPSIKTNDEVEWLEFTATLKLPEDFSSLVEKENLDKQLYVLAEEIRLFVHAFTTKNIHEKTWNEYKNDKGELEKEVDFDLKMFPDVIQEELIFLNTMVNFVINPVRLFKDILKEPVKEF